MSDGEVGRSGRRRHTSRGRRLRRAEVLALCVGLPLLFLVLLLSVELIEYHPEEATRSVPRTEFVAPGGSAPVMPMP